MEPQWLKILRGELGQAEIPGAQDNPRIQEYLKAVGYPGAHDELAWCGAVVGWAFLQCTPPIPGPRNSAKQDVSIWAPAWRSWGVPCDPKPGAVVVVKRKAAGPDAATGSSSGEHVALWTGAGDGWVQLLGGNQGNRVSEVKFLLRSYEIVATRWPKGV